MFYPGSGPRRRGKTLCPTFIVLIMMEYKVHDGLPQDRMWMNVSPPYGLRGCLFPGTYWSRDLNKSL